MKMKRKEVLKDFEYDDIRIKLIYHPTKNGRKGG